MADTVRYFLEEMVPELEDLEEKGYFTKQELREVVKKRENFEYALQRRPQLKADFLRYIEYERSLSELLQLRTASQGTEGRKGRGAAGIISRCHLLYERATRKFRGDLRLWLAWLEFCKETNSTRQMSKVLTRALQLQPTAAGLWIFAANWEFEGNCNAATARSLMQQGLRACKTDQQLWLEYLRMELIYAQKLRLRRKILGIVPPAQQEGSLREEGVPEPAETGEDAMDAVVSGGIAKVVAKEAVAKIPGSLQFRLRILEVLRRFSSQAGVDSIVQDLLTGIEEDFRDKEEAWDLRARQRSGAEASTSAFEAAVSIYEKALQTVETEKMFDMYLAFLREQVSGLGAYAASASQQIGPLKGRQRKAAKGILGIYAKARKAGKLSTEAALKWPELALECGKVVEALEAAKAGTDCHPECAAVWVQHLTLLVQHATLQQSEAKRKEATALLKDAALKAVKAVPQEGAAQVWQTAFEAFSQLHIPQDELLQQLQLSLAASKPAPLQNNMGAAAMVAVLIQKEQHGLQAARDLYSSLLRLPACGKGLFHGVLDLELEEAEQPLPHSRLKALFEAAVDVYGREDTELWVKYAKFEESKGKGSSAVYWKAMKTLANPDHFIARRT